ncbi:hypothetical protein C8Q76DRAFT_753499 [Earliella scabrosa]|nr:hypothetical protein C8Q76DRAFT_753499 [Earliella scabrosa]
MSTLAQEPISSAASTSTVDLQGIVSAFTGDCLVSLRLSFSASDSTRSFEDIPPFPSSTKPLVFLNDFGAPILSSHTPRSQEIRDVSRPLVTLPTGPRRKAMLMEKISVHAWNLKVSTLPSSELPAPSTEIEDAADNVPDHPVWVAEGSLVTSDAFGARLRSDRSDATRSSFNIAQVVTTDSNQDVTLVDPMSTSLSSLSASISSDVGHEDPARCNGPNPLIPTIMVSNSTAALHVSIEPPPTDVSLAIRRGRKPPPTLSLTKRTNADQKVPASRDSYPDIPSAFLGSPTCHSPTFEFSSGDPSKYNMGLSAMCTSLKALIPPPPFSPPPPPSPTRKLEPETRWGMVNSTQLPEVDEDEWAFAQDLVVEWHTSKGRRADISPPPSPAGDLPYVADVSVSVADTTVAAADTSLSTTDSLSLSPTSTVVESPGESINDDEVQAATLASTKQMRRKTVIIQAPELDSASPSGYKLRKNEKAAADRSIDLLPGEFDQPVPFETPAYTTVPGPTPRDSTSSGSRPASTSSAKLPVRGILKEKKSVRFSSVPSLHEYEKHDRDLAEPQEDVHPELADIPFRPATPGPSPPAGQLLEPSVPDPRKRAQVTATPLKSSPLRECHTPTSSGTAAAAATPAPTLPLPPAPPFVSGSTMAKHPAVRALARRPQAPRPSATSSMTMGSGVGGAVVGAPGLQSPTPALLEAQRRAPLKSINAGLSLPKERKPDALIPIKHAPSPKLALAAPRCTPQSQNLRAKENGIGNGNGKGSVDRRAFRTASVPVRPSVRNALVPAHERDENARRRSEGTVKDNNNTRKAEDVRRGAPAHGGGGGAGATQRGSRMPVPLRSILTKLRV